MTRSWSDIHCATTETMTSIPDPLICPLRSAIETSSGSAFFLLTLTDAHSYDMTSFATSNSSDSQYDYSDSSAIGSSTSGASSSPSIEASFRVSVHVFRSFFESSSIPSQSTDHTSKNRKHRSRSRSRHHDSFRRSSSRDSVGARSDYSHRVRPSLRDLYQLPWSRLDEKAPKLPPGTSWVISMHAVQDGKRR